MTLFLIVIWFLLIVAAPLFFFIALTRETRGQLLTDSLFRNRLELTLIIAAILAALLGIGWQVTAPQGTGTAIETSITLDGKTTYSEHQPPQKSLLDSAGIRVLRLFFIPVGLILLPVAVCLWSGRSMVYFAASFFLGVASLAGMSIFGLCFVPSGALIFAAGVVSMRRGQNLQQA